MGLASLATAPGLPFNDESPALATPGSQMVRHAGEAIALIATKDSHCGS